MPKKLNWMRKTFQIKGLWTLCDKLTIAVVVMVGLLGLQYMMVCYRYFQYYNKKYE